MRFPLILILPIALVALASCVSGNPGCAGWRQITVADETVDYLAAHDRQTLAALTAHQEAGQEFGCWK